MEFYTSNSAQVCMYSTLLLLELFPKGRKKSNISKCFECNLNTDLGNSQFERSLFTWYGG